MLRLKKKKWLQENHRCMLQGVESQLEDHPPLRQTGCFYAYLIYID